MLLELSSRDFVTPRSQERYKDLNLTPPEEGFAPEEGFELYRYKNAARMSTRGWSGLYWARKNGARILRDPDRHEGRGRILLLCRRILERGLREILREGRLVSAATPSFRSGGNSRATQGLEKSIRSSSSKSEQGWVSSVARTGGSGMSAMGAASA